MKTLTMSVSGLMVVENGGCVMLYLEGDVTGEKWKGVSQESSGKCVTSGHV